MKTNIDSYNSPYRQQFISFINNSKLYESDNNEILKDKILEQNVKRNDLLEKMLFYFILGTPMIEQHKKSKKELSKLFLSCIEILCSNIG